MDKPGKAKPRPRSAPTPKANIRGFLDPLRDDAVSGWAVDVMDPREPLRLRVVIDEVNAGIIVCDGSREDAKAYHLPSDQVGFTFQIPERLKDGSRHALRFATIDGTPVTLSTRGGGPMERLHFVVERDVTVEGVLDGMVDGLVQGWALTIDKVAKTRTGGLRIMVTASGQPVAELLADEFRGDVADALGSDAACGFTFSPPTDLRMSGRLSLQFYAMPQRVELRGSPIEVFYPSDADLERLNGLIGRADDLFRFAYRLRRELKAALPKERFMLSDYTRWAAKSAPLVLARAEARYGALPPQMPLVSVICPVYRPVISEFLTAVDSIRAQTYANWELLLVDDGSGDAALTAAMKLLAAQEPRIRLLALKKNGGISAATNAGIAAARGAFLGFFDHDDVLVPAAIEVMLRAQNATKARLLYSDEDKIDRSGALSEPHFKPGFNHRFLLELNYICHFVLADATLVKEVGAFQSTFDGAQDHDFLLRVAERLPSREIQHVPEILYHWRKTGASTAAAGAAKPKAAHAGERAVAAHLARRGLEADVTMRGALTCYDVRWKPGAQEAPAVSILIPYRDHIDLTRECVTALRQNTRGVRYEILLLDNWSNSQDAESFAVEQANLPDTRVIRITEPFNYSRINNIGAASARHEFLLLLNNDVIVHEDDWLRVMLNEALVDAAVGAVGAKLLYPNGTVQHCGVVLGVGGIADHAFRGLKGDAPGYVMRAMVAQETSAVTAACMLVRKTAFLQCGGFDEIELSIAFNDVDLCIRLRQLGWKIIFTPEAVAEHRESISRGDDLDDSRVARFMLENEVMRQRYAALLPYDPFYNVQFSRESGVYRELRLLKPDDVRPLAAGQAASGLQEDAAILRGAGAV